MRLSSAFIFPSVISAVSSKTLQAVRVHALPMGADSVAVGVSGPRATEARLSASRQDNTAILRPAPADNAPHMPLGEC